MRPRAVDLVIAVFSIPLVSAAQFAAPTTIVNPFTASGYSYVSGGWDVTGDGFGDFVACSENGTPSGGVRIYSGYDFSPWRTHFLATPRRVELVGDTNGDGSADYVVGTSWGTATLYSGHTGTVLHSQGSFPTSSDDVVGNAGDVNGDGLADFFVTSTGYGYGFAVGVGRIEVYAGFIQPNGTQRLLDAYAPAGSNHFGIGATGIGDANADGFGDLAVSAQDTGGGNTFIVSGVNGAILLTIPGVGRTGVLRIADLDADGVDDVVCGTDFFVGVYSPVSGALLASWTTIDGLPVASDSSPRYVGDVNGDGFDEIMIRVDLGVGHQTKLVSSVTGVSLATFPFAVINGGGVGNLNQDGLADLAVPFGSGLSMFLTNAPFGPALGPCAAPTVNAALGDPISTLQANGSTGGLTHRVDVGVGQPIAISVSQPSTNFLPAPFAIFGYVGVPDPTDAIALPFNVGPMCFTPYDLNPNFGGLFTLANSYTPFAPALVPSTLAPWSHSLANGLPFSFQFTLQGVISQDPATVRTTNGLIVNVE